MSKEHSKQSRVKQVSKDLGIEAPEASIASENIPKNSRHTVQSIMESLGEIELWHTPTTEAWATLYNGKGYANYAIDSQDFESWVIHQSLTQTGQVPSKEMLGRVMLTLSSKAKFDGKEHKVCIRTAGSLADAIYMDFGDASWQAMMITADGLEIVDKPPYKFGRSRGMLPLPRPSINGCIEDLRKWTNCQSEEDWRLLLAWIISALCPDGPYPIAILSGPPGSAKSTTSKFLRSLIDPSVVPLSRLPKDSKDLGAAVSNSRLLVYDNISRLSNDISDMLCMIASGSGIRERQLFSNANEALIEGGRPIILNGIGDYATRSDIADRSVLINLEPPSERRSEFLKTMDGEGLSVEFERHRPQLFEALLDILRATMKSYQVGQKLPSGNPRMMDFAILGNALGETMGWAPDAFDRAYNRNRSEAEEIALEDSILWEPLRRVFLDTSEEWSGPAAELRDKMKTAMEGDDKSRKIGSMPASAIGQQLQRITPVLKKAGWKIKKTKSGKKGRGWEISPPKQ